MFYKEKISEQTKNAMKEFILKYKDAVLTEAIIQEGRLIIDEFISESVNSYNPVSKKIAKISEKSISAFSKKIQIEKLLQEYRFDIEGHLLYEKIKSILTIK